MEPIFTDREVRAILGMHNLNYRNTDGDETLYFKLAKAVRDVVEQKFYEIALREAQRRIEEIRGDTERIDKLISETDKLISETKKVGELLLRSREED